MLTAKRPQRPSPLSPVKRRNSVVQSVFQWRYTGYLIAAVFAATSFAGGLTFYLLNENYETFIRLATVQAPSLLESLERERIWINGFLFSVLGGMLTFFFYLGFRMTARLIGPIVVLQSHMKGLIRGNLSQAQLRIREDDEYHPLIETYNYFYSSLQTQTKQDLDRLRRLNVDARNQEAYSIWEEMIREKEQQISASDAWTVEESVPRRVS
jgi:hypothetical protein